MSIEASKTRFSLFHGLSFIFFAAVVFFCWRSIESDYLILYGGTLWVFLCFIFVLVRVVSIFIGLNRRFTVQVLDETVKSLRDSDLPVYTILLPVFKEPEVIEQLVQAMVNLDYPRDKLDIKILLEWNDQTTREKLKQIQIPSFIEVLEIPQGIPQTKPRACNYGLERARGEYIVVFDAEDRPDADQLKKSLIAFENLPRDVACLQAKLNCYNTNQNIITQLFTLEYTAWFDLYLPGLYAIGAVVPLGGTSNHFRTAILKQLQGWDAYNVTEDCDLGVRIARQKLSTRVLNSTTWEEAPSDLVYWFKQRTRWLKGYLQTLFVHTKNPLSLLSDLGLWKSFLFCIVIGGQSLSLAFLLPAWIQIALWIHYRWPVLIPELPWTQYLWVCAMLLLLFNFVFVFIHGFAALFRSRPKLIPVSFCFPLYWLAAGVASWRGMIHFLFRPHHWEKTPHGMATKNESTPAVRAHDSLWVQRLVYFACVVFSLSLIKPLGSLILDLAPENCYTTIQASKSEVRCRLIVDKSWLDSDRLDLNIRMPSMKASMKGDQGLSVEVYLKVNDGEIFRIKEIQKDWPTKNVFSVHLPLDGKWQGRSPSEIFGPWSLRRVRELWVVLGGFANTSDRELERRSKGYFDIRNIRLQKSPHHRNLQPQQLRASEMIQKDSIFSVKFEIDQYFENPFDEEAIDAKLEISDSLGNKREVRALYVHEYRMVKDPLISEPGLAPRSSEFVSYEKPYWEARLRLSQPGVYQWRVVVNTQDHHEESQPRSLKVDSKPEVSKVLGPIRIRENETYWRDQAGKFIYPLGINMAWPVDGRLWGKKETEPKNVIGDDLFVFDQVFSQLQQNSMNFVRLWMTPWWGSLEWDRSWPEYQGTSNYSLKNSWRVEQALRLAETYGINIDLVIDSHGPFSNHWDSLWDFNPYNIKNAGFLVSPEEVFTNARAKKLYQNKYDYLIQRFGPYRSLSSWELWNEVNVVSKDSKILSDWHQQMALYIKERDPFLRNIGTTFYWWPQIEPDPLWRIDGLSFIGAQGYNRGEGAVASIKRKLERISDDSLPTLITEYGGHPYDGGPDEFLIQDIHEGLWASWVLPISAAAISWWWSFLSEKNLFAQYKFFSDYIKGENLLADSWRFAQLRTDQAEFQALARIGSKKSFVWIFNQNLTTYTGLGNEEHSVFRARVDQTYAEKKQKNFRPLNIKDPGHLWSGSKSLSIDLSLLPAANYKVEFWDTWGDGLVKTNYFRRDEEHSSLLISDFNRDLALKFIRLSH